MRLFVLLAGFFLALPLTDGQRTRQQRGEPTLLSDLRPAVQTSPLTDFPFPLFLGCREGEFQCRDKQCVPLASLCDNVPDCSGGEDELNCRKFPFSPFLSMSMNVQCMNRLLF